MLRIALAQTNPVVGAFVDNAAAAVDAARRAREAGADLVALGEMALSGYPIEDLATRPSFLAASHAHLLRHPGGAEQASVGAGIRGSWAKSLAPPPCESLDF